MTEVVGPLSRESYCHVFFRSRRAPLDLFSNDKTSQFSYSCTTLEGSACFQPSCLLFPITSISDNPCFGVSEDVAALLQATATPLQVVLDGYRY